MPGLKGKHNNMNDYNMNDSNTTIVNPNTSTPRIGEIWREGRIRNGKNREIRIIELKEEGVVTQNVDTGKTAIIKYKYFNRGKCGFHDCTDMKLFTMKFVNWMNSSKARQKENLASSI